MSFGTVTIVGVGLIGGSIGLALRKGGLADHVVGVGRDAAKLDAARRLGAIDRAADDPRSAYSDSSIIVVCTPVSRVPEDVCRAAADSGDAALITDAGSTKRAIVDSIDSNSMVRGRFVGAHPIAGSDRSGVEHARADLFVGSVCVLTPTPSSRAGHIERAADFWTELGCRVIQMSPDEHDRALAHTSHAPHLVAAALTRLITPEWHALAGGAFRDMTRVAASDTDLWMAVYQHNREATLLALEQFQRHLSEMHNALQADDAARLATLWEASRQARLHFMQHAPARDPN